MPSKPPSTHGPHCQYLLTSSSVQCTGDELNAQANSRRQTHKIDTGHLDARFSSLHGNGILLHKEHLVVMGCHVIVWSDTGIKIWE